MYTVFYGTDDFSGNIEVATLDEAIALAREMVSDGEEGVSIWDANCEDVDF